jgi:hypothetical protein
LQKLFNEFHFFEPLKKKKKKFGSARVAKAALKKINQQILDDPYQQIAHSLADFSFVWCVFWIGGLEEQFHDLAVKVGIYVLLVEDIL